MAEQVPDRTFVWGQDKKTKAIPKVAGFRCHVNKPTTNGFPATVESDFCAFFCERETMKQPLRHLTESTVMMNAKTATEG